MRPVAWPSQKWHYLATSALTLTCTSQEQRMHWAMGPLGCTCSDPGVMVARCCSSQGVAHRHMLRWRTTPWGSGAPEVSKSWTPIFGSAELTNLP